MKKLSKLTGAKSLNKKEQKAIHGGDYPFLPTPPSDCGCIQYSTPIFPWDIPTLEIVLVDCNSTCPDGSDPVSGLGQ